MKAYLIAGAIFLCVLTGAGLMWGVQHSRVQTLENDLRTATAQVEALTLAHEARDRADAVRERERASVTKQAKENHAALDQATAAARDWADQRVPDGIAGVLRDATRVQPAQRGAVSK